MNPTPKTSPAPRQAAAAKRQASWEYSEEFVAESEHCLAARRAAAELGIGSVSQGGAALLTLLTHSIGAKSAVEVGTGTGASGLAILTGLTPDGILTSIDSETEHQQRARAVFAGAGFAARRARLIAGPALVVLPKLSDGAYDLVFVDGDPLEYVEYVAQAARLLRSGGLLILDHALSDGAVADESNEDDNTVIIRESLDAVNQMDDFSPILLPVGDGMLVAYRN